MNTPEQNEKNLFAMKKILSEIVLALSIVWIGCWFTMDARFYWVSLLCSALIVHLLRYFKVSLKLLYVLCTVALASAILVTILV